MEPSRGPGPRQAPTGAAPAAAPPARREGPASRPGSDGSSPVSLTRHRARARPSFHVGPCREVTHRPRTDWHGSACPTRPGCPPPARLPAPAPSPCTRPAARAPGASGRRRPPRPRPGAPSPRGGGPGARPRRPHRTARPHDAVTGPGPGQGEGDGRSEGPADRSGRRPRPAAGRRVANVRGSRRPTARGPSTCAAGRARPPLPLPLSATAPGSQNGPLQEMAPPRSAAAARPPGALGRRPDPRPSGAPTPPTGPRRRRGPRARRQRRCRRTRWGSPWLVTGGCGLAASGWRRLQSSTSAPVPLSYSRSGARPSPVARRHPGQWRPRASQSDVAAGLWQEAARGEAGPRARVRTAFPGVFPPAGCFAHCGVGSKRGPRARLRWGGAWEPRGPPGRAGEGAPTPPRRLPTARSGH